MIGKKLANFEIVDHLGSGGMGDVYLAEDTKLGRRVALKLLPKEVAADSDRLARFEREARVLAALNHPNIAALYQLEQAGEIHFLVLEWVDGKPLDHLIPAEGVPLNTFFDLAIPLAEAVAAAHEKGIVHRDLKPRNILVSQEGRVKVLDFGIAKLRQESVEDLADQATQNLTADGQVVGTVPYMSPEQIKGDSVDSRSDLFSLGVVLYQLTVGRYPFKGPGSAELLASILRDDPTPVGQVREAVPPQLGRIIGHCLEKDPRRRFQSALDLQNALEDLRQQVELGEATSGSSRAPTVVESVSAPQTGGRAGRWVAALVALTVLGIAGLMVRDRLDRAAPGEQAAGGNTTVDQTGQPTRRLSQLTFGSELEEWPAWSPDGGMIVYTAERDGLMRLYLRVLEEDTVRPISEESFDQIQPAWTPDGRSLLYVQAATAGARLARSDVRGWFVSAGDVHLLDLQAGTHEKLIEEAFNPVMSRDGDRIAVDAEWAGPRRIWATDGRGRNPRQLTTDTSEAVTHTAPSWSPDGARVAYRRIQQTLSDIYVTDSSTDSTFAVTDDEYLDLDPVWSPDGRFIYFSSYRGGGLNIWRIPVTAEGRPDGAAEQMTTGPGDDLQLALDPTGRSLAFSVLRLNSDLWTLPVDPEIGTPRRGAESIVATTREESRGTWSNDGRFLAFNSDRGGSMNLWLLDLTTGESRQLTRGPGGDYQPHFSPDDRSLVFFSARSGNNDVWLLDLESEELSRLTDHPGLDINPFFSPDGESIAYMSDADGRLEVWLTNPEGDDRRRLSTEGASGHFIVWSDQGRSVVFRSGTGPQAKILRVDVASGESSRLRDISSGAHMSFSPDRTLILDVAGHKDLLVYPLDGGERSKIFAFDEPGVHVDYPVWSPDGTQIVFDRAVPQGSDIWLLEGLD